MALLALIQAAPPLHIQDGSCNDVDVGIAAFDLGHYPRVSRDLSEERRGVG